MEQKNTNKENNLKTWITVQGGLAAPRHYLNLDNVQSFVLVW